jgi:hypothetical protein
VEVQYAGRRVLFLAATRVEGLEAPTAVGLGARELKAAAVGLGAWELKASAVGLGARELKAAAVGLTVVGLKAAPALVGLMVVGLEAAALVGLMGMGLKAAALVGLTGLGLKAAALEAALEAAAGPLPLALKLLRGLPVPEFAISKQPSLREHGRPHAQLSLIAQRWN